MADRVTFGDFVLAARRNLDAAIQHSSTTTWPLPGVLATEIHEFTRGLHRVLKVMGRYITDVIDSSRTDPPSQPQTPGTRAAIEGRAAAQCTVTGMMQVPLASASLR